jgi:hypothetical protein
MLTIGVYTPRFVSEAQLKELINLYHLARGQCCGRRHDAMITACHWFTTQYPGVKPGGVYKDLSASLAW